MAKPSDLLAIATIVGIGLGFTPIDPIKALYWSAVVNGVISLPIMVVMMLMAGSSSIMGRFVIGPRLRVLGWGATGAMALAVLAMFWTMIQ